jgi:hypothetical protein
LEESGAKFTSCLTAGGREIDTQCTGSSASSLIAKAGPRSSF